MNIDRDILKEEAKPEVKHLTREDFTVSGGVPATIQGKHYGFINPICVGKYVTTDYMLKLPSETASGSSHTEFYHKDKKAAEEFLELFLRTSLIRDGKLVWSKELADVLRGQVQ